MNCLFPILRQLALAGQGHQLSVSTHQTNRDRSAHLFFSRILWMKVRIGPTILSNVISHGEFLTLLSTLMEANWVDEGSSTGTRNTDLIQR